jgi:hypothetical protein
MRTYKRNFVKKALRKNAERHIENREGILWSIDEESKTCNVYIQGSEYPVIAFFPRNLKNIPAWLRIGCAVSLRHLKGVQEYIEVTGEGRAIPTPISRNILPDVPVDSGYIVSGFKISTTETESLQIFISDGVYVINGRTYEYIGNDDGAYTPIIMNDPAPMVMGEDTLLGGILGQVGFTMPSGPSAIESKTSYRYDALYIGVDGNIKIVSGSASLTYPQYPDIPSNNILIKYILRVSTDTNIPRQRIGQVWTVPYIVGFNFDDTVFAALPRGCYSYQPGDYDGPLSCKEYCEMIPPTSAINVNSATVYLKLIDQYDNAIGAPSGGVSVTATIIPPPLSNEHYQAASVENVGDLGLYGPGCSVYSATTYYSEDESERWFNFTGTSTAEIQFRLTSEDWHEYPSVVDNTFIWEAKTSVNVNWCSECL